ncbi:hypothetical protein ASPVEDRAFT_692965 [Aspergillus versicolor CBS 583.65]|uniref:Uncharacterized protein n=1 Tax=Aspergillus versicolor CBS 583.65 TaxID=1036611 RepID=A0A1L9PMV3_ASPVE|nr:uncharacterized protein ASPVEDRAFT_692965 [Aspergillus versicolor CBS 583.65]OJJ02755.1 hypothetical protein ASPVEDRAFT_692965 [Aspergillus versicolor CBS 583.65]
MAAHERGLDPVEDDQEHHTFLPPFIKDDSQRGHSASTGLESSDGGSIYNAHIATGNDGNEALSENQPENNTLGDMDPANIAMLYSDETDRAPGQLFSRSPGGSLPDPHKPPAAHLADKLRTSSAGEITAWSLPGGLSAFHEELELSTASGDVSSNVQVSPALPEYPPPVRSPTPPGLPSFGTEEARSYDFRIGARRPIENRNVSHFRQLFRSRSPGRSPSEGSRQPRTQQLVAEDGTAVLGSFPQRQSGHGSNVLSKTNDNPFHQGNLPLAQSDGASIRDNDAASEGQSPYSAAAEDTLNSLSANLPPLQTQPTTAPNSMLLASDHGGKRPESYYTCVSRVYDSHSPLRVAMPGHSNLTEQCHLAPTQSAAPTSPQDPGTPERNSYSKFSNLLGHWEMLVKQGRSIFCCCWDSERGASETGDSADALNPHTTNTTTQDTYVTARDNISNETPQARTQIVPVPGNQSRP